MDKKDKWVQKKFDFPDIVYNRLSYRSEEKKVQVQNTLNKLQQKNMFLFNTRFLNKWEVHQALKNNPEIASYLPRTSVFSKSALYEFINTYDEVFLKPHNSSRGKGIIKIIKKPGKQLVFASVESKPLVWIKCKSFENLYHRLQVYIPYPKYYLLQQGINLAKFQKRIFDLRMQVQKDGNGKWVLTGIGVRVAAPNRFVTHIPNGGKAAPFEEVINEVFRNRKEHIEKIKRQIRIICKVVPETLEKHLGINLAIISLDVGIDINGDLYIFEVNSKPASFDEEDIRKRHLELLTDYFIFVVSQKLSNNMDYEVKRKV
ncbi:YheC/YheD family protein [Thermosyntropha sp.]|uniref:YheC/YheD family endospore coat-associated protein n=1 Tax=Thermosyntropha sp. TaxID=2740820 RepID=UPI0025DF860E|nr:YheC/YheD family protein [Thermosyntropha sp.]MBO8158418.1 YheC/YheD family protein [Thermosyntropha sp.]